MAFAQEYKVMLKDNVKIDRIYNKGQVIWPSRVTPPTTNFYVVNTENESRLTIKKNNSIAPTLTIEYSYDQENWNTLGNTSTSGIGIWLTRNRKVYLRCRTNSWTSSSGNYCNIIDGCEKIGGNILSLFYGNIFRGTETALPKIEYTDSRDMGRCSSMFYGNETLIDASDLIIPINQYGMGTGHTYTWFETFALCKNLIYPPHIETPKGRNYMGTHTFNSMFRSCISMTVAPELNYVGDTSLAFYIGMFDGCKNLNYVKCLSTRDDSYDTAYWLRNVAEVGTFVKKAGVEWESGYDGIPVGWRVIEDTDFEEPFYVENTDDSSTETVSIVKSSNVAPTLSIWESTDKINWSFLGDTSTTALTILLPTGTRRYLKCETDSWTRFDNYYTPYSNSITGMQTVGGNIMSLLYGSSFNDKIEFPGDGTKTTDNYNFYRLFANGSLTDASKLLLSATDTHSGCYQEMFLNNSSLLYSPKALPSYVLKSNCYYGMFDGCSSLQNVPSISAVTMYYKLSPSSITVGGYTCYRMFAECNQIDTAPNLAPKIIGYGCYKEMFKNCSWLRYAPELPAVELSGDCYREMFNGCYSLNYIKCYAETGIDSSSSTYRWVKDVNSEGTFVCKSNAEYWYSGESGIPDNWEVQYIYE